MKRLTLIAALVALSAAGPAGAQERFLIDWDEINEEALTYLSELIQIDTSNPPGNETQVAKYLEAILDEEGIESRLYWNDPERANLVTRIEGNGSKRPLLIMGHTDVVGVQAERWDEDPFGGLRKDGWVYGRGSLDDKDSVTAGLIVVLLLHRNRIELDRDVIFLAESGEEGTPEVGINFMVEHHWEEIDAEFALAEGGGGILEDRRVKVLGIQTSEKMPRRVTLVAHGTAGHGSTPRIDNAVVALARAVARAAAWQTEMRLNDTTRTYFERLATISTPEDAHRYLNIGNPDETEAIQQHFLETYPYHYSILRSSVVPTVLDAGFRRNVIPSQASAILDIRMLPDEDVQGFYEQLAAVIDDPNVEIVPERIYRPAAPASDVDSEMFRTLERVAEMVYPDALVVPRMSAGSSDKAQLRARGVQAYGLAPIRSIEEQNSGNGPHSDNERVSEQAFKDFLRYMWLAVVDIAASR
jgi:acetylornithine deacetylase/succinyl-diaminopimelate desuccinylase-like protein